MSSYICCVRHVFILSLVSMHAIAHAGNLERGNTFVFVETPNSWLQSIENSTELSNTIKTFGRKNICGCQQNHKIGKKFYLLKNSHMLQLGLCYVRNNIL